jgi:predicted dinucleotide-binding enzyme
MDYSARIKSLLSILVLLIIFGVSVESFGFGTTVSANTRNRQNSQADVAKAINDAYAKLAETINAHRTPAKAQIESNTAALHVRRADIGELKKNTQAQYYILKAWNKYFTDDIKTAQQVARMAMRLSSDSEDARITMASLTLLAGEKPVIVPKKKSPSKNTNTPRGYNVPAQSANLLHLDVDSLNTDLTNPKSAEKIDVMELNCLNSTTFKYTPNSEVLCVIFWKLSDKDVASVASSEPNDPSVPASRPAKAQPQHYGGYEDEYGMQPNVNLYGNSTAQKQNGTFLANTKAFKDLFAATFGTDKVKFLAVNTDSLAAKRKVAEKIMENSWPWAHVMAHDPKSGYKQFKDVAVAHEKPLMVITSNDGRIRYAGPAVGFLAPMMLSKLTGAGNNATPTAIKKQPSNGQTGVASKIMEMFNKNKTPGSNNSTGTNTTATSNRVTPQPKEMDSLEEAIAEKDLRGAKNLMGFSTGFTRRVIGPKKGIEKCREILKKYPNTKYSEEVRMLLRGLSERDRKKNKVTDEEMGL